jgi:uncharacterized integral membrane protein
MEGQRPPQRRDVPWSLIAFGVLAAYAVLIVLLNREEVDISFVFFSARISKLVLILLCLGIGFAAGYLFDSWRRRRKLRESS